MREALFSLVGHRLEGTTFLDAFAGAGTVGLEAWSRGAEVTCVERSRVALQVIRTNIAALGASMEVVAGDALRLGALQPFDGVFADPPYGDDPAVAAQALAPYARQWMVIESEGKRVELPQTVGGLELDRVRRYGRTALWVYRGPINP